MTTKGRKSGKRGRKALGTIVRRARMKGGSQYCKHEMGLWLNGRSWGCKDELGLGKGL